MIPNNHPATKALDHLCLLMRDMVAVSSEKEKSDIASCLFDLRMAILRYEPPLMHHPDGPM